tara:strand:- start:219 stop:842 length:624 start_codon:yes stop_codon:yes gene_type:complete
MVELELSNTSKNYLIIFLVVITIFSLLGINLLVNAGESMQSLLDKILPSIYKILAALGFATGTIINTTTDVAADGTRAAVDVVEGSIQSVGNMLQKASSGSLDLNIGKNNEPGAVTSDKSSSNIQNPISNKKSSGKWCLVGEYEGKRGCIEIDDSDVCMSQKIFDSNDECVKILNNGGSGPIIHSHEHSHGGELQQKVSDKLVAQSQ